MIRIVGLITILVIGGAALAYGLLSKKATTSTAEVTTEAPLTTSATTTTSASSTATSQSASVSTYKDGTYTSIGSYQSPGGDEKIGVTVTLVDDVITASSVTPMPVSGDGREYQQTFANNYKPLVVGKKISDVHLTKVSGSSLTPAGFNDALTQIEATAKA